MSLANKAISDSMSLANKYPDRIPTKRKGHKMTTKILSGLATCGRCSKTMGHSTFEGWLHLENELPTCPTVEPIEQGEPVTVDCSLCSEGSHTFTPKVKGCERCAQTPHGPSHFPSNRNHSFHCSCDYCY